MLCAGLFLANVHGGVLIAGLRPDWSCEIRNASLSVIFLRSGLELDLAVRRLAVSKSRYCREHRRSHSVAPVLCHFESWCVNG